LMRSTRSGNSNPRHFEFTNALRDENIDFTIESAGGIFDRPHAIILRETFELLRNPNPSRNIVQEHFNARIQPTFSNAVFNKVASVISKWNLEIHTPPGGARRKVYPQQLLHELLDAFGIASSNLSDSILRDLGVFSNIILDIEKVFISIDSAFRYSQILNFLSNVADSGYDVSTVDLITKPDAVMVSTIHKMKGLEYPVVFLVDLVNQRFPVNRSTYRGWLPPRIMQEAINRGAYGSSIYDEARLFYTALTRAERFLYITGSATQPDTTTQKSPSQFSRRLTHEELSTDTNLSSSDLEKIPEKRRFDETEVPTSYSQIKDFLTCPMKYKFRQHFGFSPPVPEMFGFGLTTHAAIGKLHQMYPSSAPSGQEAEDLAKSIFYLKHSFPSSDPVNRPGGYENAKNRSAEIVKTYVENFSTDFTQGRQVEARFEVKAEKSLITGAIDLLLKEDKEGNILDAKVIDFKSLETPDQNEDVSWIDLALQVQLYAHAARQILGENAKTGLIHFLKQNQRIEVPVSDEAIESAIKNIEWAVERILDNDFPQRPSSRKCDKCDFVLLCNKNRQDFKTTSEPPAIHIPNNQQEKVLAFSECN
jgi:DNA helicase-2/ATP-dependent DNA helicase PcrA